jgi:hypothetical protein
MGVTVTEVCGSNLGVPELSIIGEQIHQQKFEACDIFINFVLFDNMEMIRCLQLCEAHLINVTCLEFVVLQFSAVGSFILQSNLHSWDVILES